MSYQKKCSQKFGKIQRKAPVPESLFEQSCRLRTAALLKKREISKNTFFTEHIPATASSSTEHSMSSAKLKLLEEEIRLQNKESKRSRGSMCDGEAKTTN